MFKNILKICEKGTRTNEQFIVKLNYDLFFLFLHTLLTTLKFLEVACIILLTNEMLRKVKGCTQWFSWFEHRPIRQKVVGSSPVRACIWRQPINVPPLSLFPLPSSLSKINKYILK